jgi:hypothetical protein
MTALPTNVSTGIIRISLRRVVQDQTVPVNGVVRFRPSPTHLAHPMDGLLLPSSTTSVFLDSNGDGVVTLMATDDTDVNPSAWTYEVSFELEEGMVIDPFHISVPSASDQELSDLAPQPASGGVFYVQGPAGTVSDEQVANVLGVALVVSDTPPEETTLYGKPVIWLSPGALINPVPVLPTAPTFNTSLYTVTAPSLVGVQYQVVEGVQTIPLVNGVSTSFAGHAKPWTMTVEAVAKAGYALTSAYTWTQAFT